MSSVCWERTAEGGGHTGEHHESKRAAGSREAACETRHGSNDPPVLSGAKYVRCAEAGLGNRGGTSFKKGTSPIVLQHSRLPHTRLCVQRGREPGANEYGVTRGGELALLPKTRTEEAEMAGLNTVIKEIATSVFQAGRLFHPCLITGIIIAAMLETQRAGKPSPPAVPQGQSSRCLTSH